MIKILYLPLNVGGNKQSGTVEAFQSLDFVGLQIYDFYGRFEQTRNAKLVCQEFEEVVARFQPQWIHMQLQMTGIVTKEVLERIRNRVNGKVLITNWSGDVRNEAEGHFVSIAKAVDHALISSVGQLELYKKAGATNVKYWQIGYDPKMFYPKWKKNFKYDLIFAGNAYKANTFQDSNMRNNIIAELKAKLGSKMIVCGSGYPSDVSSGCVVGSALNDLYNDARCILSISNYNNIDLYFSDRLLTCLASGRPTISMPFPNYQTYFSDNCDILMASNSSEIIRKLEWCKNNEETSNEIGYNGWLTVNNEHTYKSRIIELMNSLGLI